MNEERTGHNGQPSRGGDRKTFEVITSTYQRGTLGSVASLLAATELDYISTTALSYKKQELVPCRRHLSSP